MNTPVSPLFPSHARLRLLACWGLMLFSFAAYLMGWMSTGLLSIAAASLLRPEMSYDRTPVMKRLTWWLMAAVCVYALTFAWALPNDHWFNTKYRAGAPVIIVLLFLWLGYMDIRHWRRLPPIRSPHEPALDV